MQRFLNLQYFFSCCVFRVLSLIQELWKTITGEAGWTPDQWGHTRYKLFNTSADSVTKQKQLTALMRALLKVVISFLPFNDLSLYQIMCKIRLQLHFL